MDHGDPGKRSTQSLLLLSVLSVVVALAFRLPLLELRPMHGDEANQAVKTGDLLERGYYRYDPTEHHGPTLYYSALLSAIVRGEDTLAATSETTFRIVPALFGAGLVALVFGLWRGLGTSAVVVAGILCAVSPTQAFYSRYFIQETLLAFLTLALIVCAWRYARRPGVAWAAAAGAAFGLMHATKETCVIAWGAMIAAAIADAMLRRRHGSRERESGFKFNARHAAVACTVAIACSAVLYSSFFSNLRGPLDSILTYGTYLDRAAEPGVHDKPWHYYLGLLAYMHRGPGPYWSEGMILALACIGLVIALRFPEMCPGSADFTRLLALYALFVTVFYSAIPYKTPWSMLSLHLALVLMAGTGGAALLKASHDRRVRAAVAALLIAGMVQLGYQSYVANFSLPADPRNPYVYGHTSTAFLKLVDRVHEISKLRSDDDGILIKVIEPKDDYWPLPWYLRSFERVGYWSEIPENADADMIIASPDLGARLEESLKDKYVTETHGLRPSVLLHVYIQEDLWEEFVRTRI